MERSECIWDSHSAQPEYVDSSILIEKGSTSISSSLYSINISVSLESAKSHYSRELDLFLEHLDVEEHLDQAENKYCGTCKWNMKIVHVPLVYYGVTK